MGGVRRFGTSLLLALLVSACGGGVEKSAVTKSAIAVAPCGHSRSLVAAPLPQEQGVYRAGPLTLAVGTDLAQMPAAQSGSDAIAILRADRPVTVTVDPSSRAHLTFQVVNGTDVSGVRFPACGGGVHRFMAGITFAGAGCVRLHVQPGGEMLIPIGNSLSGCPDRLGHHALASGAFPYLGVSCPVGDAISCDRVGIGVVLHQPAVLVTVQLAGRTVALSPPTDPGSDLWLGYLNQAGLRHGPLAVQAKGGSWDGDPPVAAHVVLTAFFSDGTVAATAGVDQLHAGFG